MLPDANHPPSDGFLEARGATRSGRPALIARDYGARLIVLHVAEEAARRSRIRSSTPRQTSSTRPPEEDRARHEALKERLARPSMRSPKLPVEFRVRDGDAAEEILREAEEAKVRPDRHRDPRADGPGPVADGQRGRGGPAPGPLPGPDRQVSGRGPAHRVQQAGPRVRDGVTHRGRWSPGAVRVPPCHGNRLPGRRRSGKRGCQDRQSSNVLGDSWGEGLSREE